MTVRRQVNLSENIGVIWQLNTIENCVCVGTFSVKRVEHLKIKILKAIGFRNLFHGIGVYGFEIALLQQPVLHGYIKKKY